MSTTEPTGTKRGRLLHTARHGDPDEREQARAELEAANDEETENA